MRRPPTSQHLFDVAGPGPAWFEVEEESGTCHRVAWEASGVLLHHRKDACGA